MVSKQNAETLDMTGGRMSAPSNAPIESATAARTSTMKRRQTSLRNFFADKTTRTVSFQEEAHNRKRTANFYPMTPPTPLSPHTPQTPPTIIASPHRAATPPTPDVVAIFKKPKRQRSSQELVRSAVPLLRKGGENKKALEQTYLDLGQCDFGKRTICTTCGMLYVHGLNEDSQQHSRICLDYLRGVPFNVPQARVVASDLLGSIVEIRPTDNYALRTKVKRVKDIVDRDLGFVPSDETFPRTAYLYIVNKRVVGMASTEVIQHAFCLENTLERSSLPRKAMVGVHQLWVHAKFRSQKVATRLVDAVRTKFIFGLTVPKAMLAFSSPTEAGALFARNYVCGDSSNCEILVYDCC